MRRRRWLVFVALIPLFGMMVSVQPARAAGVPTTARIHAPIVWAGPGQSPNWWGYVESSPQGGTPFREVSGDWIVPTASLHTKGQAVFAAHVGPEAAVGEMERLHDLASLMRSHPDYEAPERVTAAIRREINSGQYKVLE
jgi:hypothetical protein